MDNSIDKSVTTFRFHEQCIMDFGFLNVFLLAKRAFLFLTTDQQISILLVELMSRANKLCNLC